MNATDIAAWLALLIGVIGLYWKWQDRKPQLVFGDPGVIALGLIRNDALELDSVLAVYIHNPSDKPIHVSELELTPLKGENLFRSQKRLNMLQFKLPLAIFTYPDDAIFHPPFTVEPMRGCYYYFRWNRLQERLTFRGFNGEVRARIKVLDETNREYRSKIFTVSIEEFSESVPVDEEAA
ncbi:MAG TPA: hypothetical protein VJ183_05160 [Chloroflexia bacterium]|nr:hypothetical protein [Chloroflexia bacterium]